MPEVAVSMPHRILIVEDEPGLRLTLADRLQSEGYEIETAADGMHGYRRALDELFDLIVLDILLPGRNGLDVCRDLRREGIPIPILMLTARGQMVDKVLGLKLGADDYMTKPFEMIELLARIEALLRRTPRGATAADAVCVLGAARVDMRSAEVIRGGLRIPLAAREFQLFRYLLDHRGEVISREQILKEVWGYRHIPATRTVDVHISWLRQKLEEDPANPQWIVTAHRLGYRLTA
jgi:two-component system, OmpR family, alkaline phosphatase synthesis response regulator PhoP